MNDIVTLLSNLNCTNKNISTSKIVLLLHLYCQLCCDTHVGAD